MISDFGQVLSIAGPSAGSGLKTTYEGGSTLEVKNGTTLTVFLNVDPDDAPTPVTSIQVRIVAKGEASDTWRPIQSTRIDIDETAAPADAEHSFANVAGAAVLPVLRANVAGCKFVRVETKHTGGTSTSQDVVTAYAAIS